MGTASTAASLRLDCFNEAAAFQPRMEAKAKDAENTLL